MRPQFTSYQIATFLSRIDTSAGPDGCWPTTQARDTSGYGRIRFGQPTFAMHRLMYEFVHGPIPDDMLVCHTCDNPPCCNPAHLFVGSAYDNAMDRESKKRLNHPRGETHAHSHLTNEDVLAIRARFPQESKVALSLEYRVSKSTIWRIVNRKVWTHI